jgi:hypothetical protein
MRPKSVVMATLALAAGRPEEERDGLHSPLSFANLTRICRVSLLNPQ